MSITCYGRTEGPGWVQEMYATASRDARRRAARLRRQGYAVTVQPLGPQATRVGRVTLTLVHIRGGDVPTPDQLIEL